MDKYSLTTKMSWSRTSRDIEEAFRRWGVVEWDTNYPRGARLEGFSQSEQDRKVVLTYWKDSKKIVLEMAKQDRAIDNLRVLYLAVESMRMNEKRGIAEVMQSAYLQIGAPTGKRDPYEVLGLPIGTALAVCEAQFKELAKSAHPDAGGSAKDFQELSVAIEEIRKNNK